MKTKIIGVLLVVIFALIFAIIPKDDLKQLGEEVVNRFKHSTSIPKAAEITEETTTLTEGIRLTFLDVGQGDSILIECEGRSMLVDGGTNDYSDMIYSALQSRGITHLDVMVSTHGHLDHCGGLPGAFRTASVSTVYVPTLETYGIVPAEIFLDQTRQAGYEPVVIGAGDQFTLGSAVVDVLAPVDTEQENVNNTSLVLKVTYQETAFLLMGDAEIEEIDAMLDSGADVKCDVIKMGHHGSSNGNTYRLLYEAYPKAAVIQVGKQNQYFQPTEKTLSRLKDAGIQCFRTDMQGDIICISDGKSIRFEVSRNVDVDTYGNAGSKE